MKRLMLLLCFVVVSCDQADTTKKGAGSGGSAAPADEVSVADVRDQACACKDQDCATRVSAELTINAVNSNRHMAKRSSASTRSRVAMARMPSSARCAGSRTRSACAGTRRVSPTQAQDEAADKIEDEMDKCKERVDAAR